MQTKNKERFDKLLSLTPIDAIQAFLDGDFGIGDERAIISAIRKDERITLSDDEIIDSIFDAMEKNLNSSECFERLASSK
jgi:hypothetical protein